MSAQDAIHRPARRAHRPAAPARCILGTQWTDLTAPIAANSLGLGVPMFHPPAGYCSVMAPVPVTLWVTRFGSPDYEIVPVQDIDT